MDSDALYMSFPFYSLEEAEGMIDHKGRLKKPVNTSGGSPPDKEDTPEPVETLPNGTIVHPDGCRTMPDGRIIRPVKMSDVIKFRQRQEPHQKRE